MECSQPGALREEDFLAYLAGESVRPVVEQHLATCRYCAARLESYRRIELTLTSTLYRWDCPPSHVLGEYQLGLLSGDVATAVRLHVGMCVHCAAELETLSAFLANDPLLVGHTSAEQLAANAPTLDTAAPANHHHSGARQTLEHLRERAAASARR